MCVVKADAYGHGAVECSRRLVAEGAQWLAAATAEEAVELRHAGILARILVCGSIFPGQEREFLNFDLTPILIVTEQAEALNAEASDHDLVAKVHVKIDTGMNRVGFRRDDWEAAAARLSELRNIEVEGLMTHFAVAEKSSENEFTEHQMAEFARAVAIFHDAGHRPQYIDMANSPGAVMHPLSRSKMVRIGGLLYGLADDVIKESRVRPDLKPVMSLHSRVAQVKKISKGETVGYGRTFRAERETVVATIPIGYNDGYRRGLSNQLFGIVNGKKASIAGRISMDWTTLDVTDCGNVDVGDQVTLIGTDGAEKVTAADLAQACDTISYEITCGIAARVPRIYSGKVL
jgi:alanine racemase